MAFHLESAAEQSALCMQTGTTICVNSVHFHRWYLQFPGHLMDRFIQASLEYMADLFDPLVRSTITYTSRLFVYILCHQ